MFVRRLCGRLVDCLADLSGLGILVLMALDCLIAIRTCIPNVLEERQLFVHCEGGKQ
jgi:hypothetical protein